MCVKEIFIDIYHILLKGIYHELDKSFKKIRFFFVLDIDLLNISFWNFSSELMIEIKPEN